MPPIEKAERRDRKRVRSINSKFQNVRYRTLRSGESLIRKQAAEKTLLEGRAVKKQTKRKK